MKIVRYVQHSTSDEIGTAIATAARRRFQRFGYAKTSMQEIAADCGMSVANLYRYHEGKLAIAEAVAVAEQAAQFVACDQAVQSARTGTADRLIALFHALIDSSRRRIRQTPLLFELGLDVARETPSLRQSFLQEVEARIGAILQAGENGTGPLGADAIRAQSRLILTANAPFVLPWMMLNEPFGNPRPQVSPLVRCLVTGLHAARRPSAVDATNPRR